MRYRRDRTPGACYFFTLVTWKRRPILTLPANIQRLREAFRKEIGKHPFQIDAIVILPDHLHALWRLPSGDCDYSGRWSRIKRHFSIACQGTPAFSPPSRRAKREKAVWQRRFWEHRIRDERDWQRHMDYIHFNPVKHGVADKPLDWKYSSFAACVRKEWYEKDWGASEPEHIRGMEME